ncbi:MAG: HAD-IA family hydrolase [Candidatus Bathyarchaeota archaeon]|nr:HAD-IA family hydrolase [Candidatus Bathyarchaeota archaeon]
MAQQKLEAKALLIDLDGTIVDSLEAFAEAAETALSTIGGSQSSDNVGLEIARRLQRNLLLDEFFNKTNVDEDLREKFLTLFLQSFYKIAPSKTKLFPNVDKTLRKLSRNFLLALITRRRVPKRLVKKELERLHLDSYFTTIVTSLEVERPTPFPDAILKAADELQVPVHDCVVVSDSGVDVQAGKSAGAKTVAVLSGLFKKEELIKEIPDLIIKDITCLPVHLLAT